MSRSASNVIGEDDAAIRSALMTLRVLSVPGVIAFTLLGLTTDLSPVDPSIVLLFGGFLAAVTGAIYGMQD